MGRKEQCQKCEINEKQFILVEMKKQFILVDVNHTI